MPKKFGGKLQKSIFNLKLMAKMFIFQIIKALILQHRLIVISTSVNEILKILKSLKEKISYLDLTNN